MHIDIEKVIADLEIEDERGDVGVFYTNLSVGKEKIMQLLDQIQKQNLNVYEASDETDELHSELSTEILRLLKQKDVQIEYVSICYMCHEQYVNEFPNYFEWEVMEMLSSFQDSMYYKKKDIEWMRKLLNTPFDAPAAERLKIYHDWQTHWHMRGSAEKAEHIPSFESYKPGFTDSKGMHIDVEKVMANLFLDEQEAEIGTFWSDLSIGKGTITHLLNTIEKYNTSLVDARNKASHLQSLLRDRISEILKEKGFSIKVLTLSYLDNEEYVNQYPTFFEWLILGIINTSPVAGDRYLKEDIAWMRKLLVTPFDAPAEERLRIYHDWKAYWEMRSNMAEHDALPAVE